MSKIGKYALLSLLSFTILCGCGKKEEKVGDKLSSADPNEIQGLDQYKDMKGIEYEKEDEDSQSSVSSDSVSNNSVSGNSVSGNSVSGNSVSDNNVTDSSVSVDTVSVDSAAALVSEDDAAAEDEDSSKMSIESNFIHSDNSLNIYNLSGKNIKQLYITFSAGNLKSKEILGDSKLNDGKSYVYSIADMDSLKNAERLTLEINAIGKNEDDISFGTIEIIDPTNMKVVLYSDGDDYGMYLK